MPRSLGLRWFGHWMLGRSSRTFQSRSRQTPSLSRPQRRARSHCVAPRTSSILIPANSRTRRRIAMSKTDPSRRDDILGKILSYLVAATTILGIPVGLYGYYSTQAANRVDRAFEFYKDFRGDALQKDFSLLVDNWNSHADDVTNLLRGHDEVGLSQLVDSILQPDPERTALTELVMFFDGVYSCVDNSLCDRNTTIALLQSTAGQVFSMYGSYLINVRQKNSTYAIGIIKVRALTKAWSLF
jgi:hypothetical protein